MTFDWADFFASVGIETRTSGKNVKRGWVNINCPFCGDDTGFHMGCNPQTGGFACWRGGKDHGAGGPAKLIKVLKGCTWEEARKIAGEDEVRPGSMAETEKQSAALDRDDGRAPLQTWRRLPDELEPILHGPVSNPYRDYLAGRGFDPRDVSRLVETYDLRRGSGPVVRDGIDWTGRLILPFILPGGAYAGWQGRALSKHARLRYLSEPGGDQPKRILFNEGLAADGGEVLVVVEGPMDCLKVDFYGRPYGYRAVATLGTSFLGAQVARLWALARRYDRLLLLYDPGAEAAVLDLADRLSPYAPVVGDVSPWAEDPGALSPVEVPSAIKACVQNSVQL
jgi:hypothetical protein